MTARHGSAGPGVAHRGVIYVAYTEGYYQRQRALADEVPADEASLAKYMERDVFMLPANATVREALAYFAERKISGAPIVSPEGGVVGYLSDGDVMRYLRSVGHNVPAVGAPALLLDCLRESGSKFEARLTSIMDQLALDVGSDHPVTIPVSTSFEDICRLLSESGVKKIPVVSDGQVVGIASRSAITTYLVRRFLDQAGM